MRNIRSIEIKIKPYLLSLFLMGFVQISWSADSTSLKKPTFSWDAYLETYVAWDFQSAFTNNLRPDFAYNHKRTGMVDINLALLRGSYKTEHLQLNLGIMTGSYARFNLTQEPALLRFLYEANIRAKLSSRLSLDAGVFPSHIGMESAIGTDNWLLTRSMLADNSPYYEAGVKLNYQLSPKLQLSGLVLNGWQTMVVPNSQRQIAGGWQLSWKPHSRLVINSSSYWGISERPARLASSSQQRRFHNFYLILEGKKRLDWALGMDIGWQRDIQITRTDAFWTGAFLQARYRFSHNWKLALRAEYFSDPKRVIMPDQYPQPFFNTALSLNLDKTFKNFLTWRVEPKCYFADYNSITWSNTYRKAELFGLTTALCARF